MIPYILSEASPQGSYFNYANIQTSCHVCKDSGTLHSTLLDYIVEFVYEFCSKEYGHGIDITSYNDFCDKWWSRQDRELINIPIFEIHYFENDEWKEWKTYDNETEIFEGYMKMVDSKKKQIKETD